MAQRATIEVRESMRWWTALEARTEDFRSTAIFIAGEGNISYIFFCMYGKP